MAAFTDFTYKDMGHGVKLLMCKSCNNSDMRVIQEPTKRRDARHQNRVAAYCMACNKSHRLKLGTFRSPKD